MLGVVTKPALDEIDTVDQTDTDSDSRAVGAPSQKPDRESYTKLTSRCWDNTVKVFLNKASHLEHGSEARKICFRLALT